MVQKTVWKDSTKKGTQYKENHRKYRQGSMAFLSCTFFLEDKRTVRTIQAEPR